MRGICLRQGLDEIGEQIGGRRAGLLERTPVDEGVREGCEWRYVGACAVILTVAIRRGRATLFESAPAKARNKCGWRFGWEVGWDVHAGVKGRRLGQSLDNTAKEAGRGRATLLQRAPVGEDGM